MIVLIGHGGTTGEPRLSLTGPDLTAADLARFLAAFPTQSVAVVNSSSASGDFQGPLASPKRTVITATKSSMEGNEAVFGGFFNAGECCNAGSRLIVHENIADDFLAAVKALTARVKVGDPLDDATRVGAMISTDHLAKVSGYVEAATSEGATIAAGGAGLPASAGQYLDPTIVSGVRPDMAIAREEVFGPVLSVLTFDTVEQAVRIANDTPYGLSAGVWSADIDTCMTVSRGARSGTVWVNTFMEGYPELPFGGYKQSGLGRELGKRAVEDYTEEKTIQFHSGRRTAWWVG